MSHHSQRTLGRFLLLSPLLLAVVMSSASVWAADGEPYLESVDGRDFVRLERGGESIELYPGDLIEVGDLIDSGGGGCKVILPGIAEISVSERTKIQWLGNATGSPQFNVTEGMIWARVTKTDPVPTACRPRSSNQFLWDRR